jgi:hypothetical protein
VHIAPQPKSLSPPLPTPYLLIVAAFGSVIVLSHSEFILFIVTLKLVVLGRISFVAATLESVINEDVRLIVSMECEWVEAVFVRWLRVIGVCRLIN